jgi:hypothetical protein
MKERSTEANFSGRPEQNTQESVESLKSTEVRNPNNEVQQPAPNGAKEIKRLVREVAGGTILLLETCDVQTTTRAGKC